LQHGDCFDNEACDDKFRCQPACTVDAECGAEFCDPDRRLCFECLLDAQCTGGDPVCIANQCEQCRIDEDCDPGETCDIDKKCTNVGGRLEFNNPDYNDDEDNGATTITVRRVGGTVGAVTVDYATSDGTATLADADYTAANGTLSWADGEDGNKTFDVVPTVDTSQEPDETVNLTLSNPTGGAALGNRDTSVLTIKDDD